MAPPPVQTRLPDWDGLKLRVRTLIASHRVMIFSKSYCPYCNKVKELFNSMRVEYYALELDVTDDGASIQQVLAELTNQRTVPNVFVNGTHIGGCDATYQAYQDGSLQKLLGDNQITEPYEYDLIIIGGGSGGLACSKNVQIFPHSIFWDISCKLGANCQIVQSDIQKIQDSQLNLVRARIAGDVQEFLNRFEAPKDLIEVLEKSNNVYLEAAALGKKVMVLDYVVPTPLGTSWGLGGTCVNVGCIPKKLMHQAALLGQALQDSRKYGWQYEEQVKHNWEIMVEAIQNYIGSLNWGYRVSLREKSVTYLNSYGEFVEPHKIKATNRKGQVTYHTAETFVLATGERPRYPGIPGDKEFCITSDDLFSLPYCPGKTLVVGASYVALECAGFMAGLGLDVTVMVEQLEQGMPGRLKVTAKSTEGPEILEEEYNTVLIAIGRDACTRNIGLQTIGVKINEKNGKVPVNDEEQTNVPYVYAIGDILDGKLELTPVAIQAGRLLARRLYGGSSRKCDYINVPTTVFTPLEYGSCGYPEERAIDEYGKQNLEVYHTLFWPLEWTVPGRDNNTCYAKVICSKQDNNRVIGLHVLGPNAGEVTQGFAAAIKCGLTKELLDETIGIHPTCAEVFTTMDITKSSGQDITQKGC
ncbi:hypothetical protein DUI87_24434 [Hirundo rustica rustica]|uniref:Uncharacterized protein n=1 Tax=Hirundo rustica rustica TaxID=333673 RepID=A0A3M0JEY8_HIRRU|nr:hypothetical protein DUI87_24434 [Hirundo rustica rustica]